jgi:polyisoprenoid-binding protein YceI
MIRLFACLLLLSLSACVSAPTRDPVDIPPGDWQLDQRHASVTWRARHFGLSWFTARFDTVDASLTFDAAAPEAARLTAIIEADSVSTGQPAFDDTLRGGNWFAADRHPQIVFESHDIEITGEQTGIAHGELTIRGVTHAAEMHIEFYGGNFNFLESRDAIGFGADMMVSRSDYGIGQLIPAAIAGDDVRIRIEAEFLRED